MLSVSGFCVSTLCSYYSSLRSIKLFIKMRKFKGASGRDPTDETILALHVDVDTFRCIKKLGIMSC